MEFTVNQIASILGGTVKGDDTLKINQLAKIEEGQEGCISFLANPKYEPFLYTTEASAVIVNRDFQPKQEVNPALIFVDNSYSAFTRLLEEVERLLRPRKSGVEQPSYMAVTAVTGEGIYRGAFSYIGEGCRIGSNVKIFPQAYIADNVTIGDNSVIHPGVRIYENTVIGKNCVIQANAVIGSAGFGFAPQPDGSYRTIPQLGNVVIEDDVSIGANTTIDCATMGSTIIRQGVKLDNLIQIAHNVEIGRNTVIAAQSGVSGSTKIGENCIIAGQVGIVGHITIANGTKVGAQSGIGKTIKQEGTSVKGSPATDIQENLRSLAVFRKLPQLDKRLTEVESKLNNQRTGERLSPNGQAK